MSNGKTYLERSHRFAERIALRRQSSLSHQLVTLLFRRKNGSKRDSQPDVSTPSRDANNCFTLIGCLRSLSAVVSRYESVPEMPQALTLVMQQGTSLADVRIFPALQITLSLRILHKKPDHQ
jgi:hypothetical protein